MNNNKDGAKSYYRMGPGKVTLVAGGIPVLEQIFSGASLQVINIFPESGSYQVNVSGKAGGSASNVAGNNRTPQQGEKPGKGAKESAGETNTSTLGHV